MNNTLLILGAICLVCGVMGFMYASDQAEAHYTKALFSGKSYSSDYSAYKLGTYVLAGLAVLGGVLTAAGIFSNPAPVPERESAAASGGENPEPLKPIDEATRKEIKSRYFKYGVVLLVAGLGASSLPNPISVLGILVAITGFFLIAFTLIL